MIQGVFGEVAKELAQGFRAVQDVAVHQPVDLPEILLSFGQTAPRHKRLTGV
jgi:hypothetical protein